MSNISYPAINCSNNNTGIKIQGNQIFCVSAPLSTFAPSDAISIKINGTFKIPTNVTYTSSSIRIDQEDITCPDMRPFNPRISNINYACKGDVCPIPNNSSSSMDRSAVSNVCDLRTVSGPNVILVHNYKAVENHNVVDSSVRNKPAYNKILAYTEGNTNICPENEWDTSASIDTKCHCPWNKIKKYTDGNRNKIKCA